MRVEYSERTMSSIMITGHNIPHHEQHHDDTMHPWYALLRVELRVGQLESFRVQLMVEHSEAWLPLDVTSLSNKAGEPHATASQGTALSDHVAYKCHLAPTTPQLSRDTSKGQRRLSAGACVQPSDEQAMRVCDALTRHCTHSLSFVIFQCLGCC